MKTLGKCARYTIRKRSATEFHEDRTEEVKKQLVPIIPTRENNIMWQISYEANIRLPSDFIVYYFSKDLNSLRTTPKSTLWWETKLGENGRMLSPLIDSHSAPNGHNDEKLSYMGFDSRGINEDFEFSVEIFLKYTYIISAGKFQREVSFPGGLLYHEEGDKFGIEYNTENEFVVMNINHEDGLVFCGAIGYNL